MDVKLIADRYISRGGGPPVPTRDEVTSDVLALAMFIGWHQDDDLWGGRSAGETFDALCRLLNLDRIEMRKIVRGEARLDVVGATENQADDDDVPF